MLSVCITVKNRSCIKLPGRTLRLFPSCVRSLAEALSGSTDSELVVSDWASDDWPLRDWLPQAIAPVPCVLATADGAFCRGRGLNVAAQHAAGRVLLFLDADMLISAEVIAAGLDAVVAGKAFFPICYSYRDATHARGWWRSTGYGNAMLSRATFARAGRWPELGRWGGEDNRFHARVRRVSPIVRRRAVGLYHQWHPNDLAWKNRYAQAVRE